MKVRSKSDVREMTCLVFRTPARRTPVCCRDCRTPVSWRRSRIRNSNCWLAWSRIRNFVRWPTAWQVIEATQRQRAELLGQSASFNSQLYRIAETLNLMAAEDQKPSEQRLREFRDSARESLLQQLFSPCANL